MRSAPAARIYIKSACSRIIGSRSVVCDDIICNRRIVVNSPLIQARASQDNSSPVTVKKGVVGKDYVRGSMADLHAPATTLIHDNVVANNITPSNYHATRRVAIGGLAGSCSTIVVIQEVLLECISQGLLRCSTVIEIAHSVAAIMNSAWVVYMVDLVAKELGMTGFRDLVRVASTRVVRHRTVEFKAHYVYIGGPVAPNQSRAGTNELSSILGIRHICDPRRCCTAFFCGDALKVGSRRDVHNSASRAQTYCRVGVVDRSPRPRLGARVGIAACGGDVVVSLGDADSGQSYAENAQQDANPGRKATRRAIGQRPTSSCRTSADTAGNLERLPSYSVQAG